MGNEMHYLEFWSDDWILFIFAKYIKASHAVERKLCLIAVRTW